MYFFSGSLWACTRRLMPMLLFVVGLVWPALNPLVFIIGATLLERDPQFALANFSLYEIYSQKKMIPEMDEALRGMETSGQAGLPVIGPAPGDALVGRTAKARKELVELQRLEDQGKQLAYSIAVVYASLGDHDQAFHWLDVAYSARDGSLILLKSDPSLDVLREDPRFAELLRKMNLAFNT